MSDLKTATKRQLGSSDLKCAPIGLGCMSFSGVYGAADDDETVDFVRAAIDQGIDFLDSSDMYGWGHSLVCYYVYTCCALSTNLVWLIDREELLAAAICSGQSEL